MHENPRTIPRIAVESSQIKTVGHDKESDTLVVEFSSGQIAVYHPVDVSAAIQLINAESVGKHFGQHIKSNKSLTFRYA